MKYQKIILCFLVCVGCQSQIRTDVKLTKPNVVIIFLDDSGWGDFEPFSSGGVATPNVERLAAEGVVYQNFYVPQAICYASRAALLTGSYPERTRVFNAHGPKERGLEVTFPTMAEIFKADGYSTAIFGKWHFGDQEDTRPDQRGFDVSSGLMYSNDMWRFHPEQPEYWGRYPLQYWKNGAVVIEDLTSDDQRHLTQWYTEGAVNFINEHKKDPFLLYIPHSMPHVPIFCGEEFEGKSGIGLYGDVLMELDASVGQIISTLDSNGLTENTIIVFTSDNGPWISYGNHAGVTPFREAKGTSFEGGTRVACVIKYPGHLTPGRVSEKSFMSIDLFPTLAYLTETSLPDLPIDGKNVWQLISDESAPNPQEYYAFTTGKDLEAIMSGDGRWKLHLPHSFRTDPSEGEDGIPGKYQQVSIDWTLYDLLEDPLETTDVQRQAPQIFERLKQMAERHLIEFNLL